MSAIAILRAEGLAKVRATAEGQKRAVYEVVFGPQDWEKFLLGWSVSLCVIAGEKHYPWRRRGGQAFKRNQIKLRFYGFDWPLSGKRTFIIVDHDPAKKQTKADQKILKRAKGRVDDLVDRLRKRGKEDGPKERK